MKKYHINQNTSNHIGLIIEVIRAATLIFILILSSPSYSQDHIEHPIGPPPTTLDYDGNLELLKIYKIPANPDKGFYWPYYLATPKQVDENMSMYVEPNNDGRAGHPFETHEYWASIKCEQALIDYTNTLGTFALVPVFPRPSLENGNNLYTHALTRAVIEEESMALKRIDLQLLAMIGDAQSKIKENDYQIPDKVMLWGFSAAGDFVTRMAMIHPEKIQCVVAGGMGGLPILPLEEIKNEDLCYPVGLADFEQLFNKPFDNVEFKSIPMKFFQGEIDENDSVAEGDELVNKEEFLSDSYSYNQCLFINKTFGVKPIDRISKVSKIYSDFGSEQFEYVIVPNTDHKTEPFEGEVLKFLKDYGSK